MVGERLSSSGTRINTSSPVYIGKSTESIRGKSVSKQSLLDIVSSRLGVGSSSGGGGRSKRFSRESFSAAYINRAHVASSELDVSRKAREARRRDIRNRLKLERWETSTSGSDRQGCKWTFVFDPAGRLCYYWSMVVSLAFLYNFWVLIYRFAFQEIASGSTVVWFCLDYLADFLYLLDIAFHFRTGYLEDGVLQTDSTKLRIYYMNSTTFYIDCLCLLPLDFLYLSIGYNSMLRCFRLVKVYRFWAFMDRTERHTNYPNLFRSISLVHYLLVIFHWNASLYYIIHKNKGFGSKNWVFSNEGNSSDDVVMQYLQSYYWCTLTLITIGDLPRPRTKGEFLFVILQLLFGLLLFATVLGHVANIVTSVSAARKEFQAKLDGVKTYMRMRRVPNALQVKVIKWFDYLWLTQKCSDEEKAVSCLPDKLKAEIAINVHLDTLKRVEIFQNTEAGFLCELVLRLRPVLFSPGDYICRKGEVGKEMYIVNRGRLQVVADNGKTVLATLKAGSYFGEISILNMGTAGTGWDMGNRRTASVRSVGYSDLFVLSKKDMWDVLKEYPAARVRLEAIAVKRLEKYKKAPLEKAQDEPRPSLLAAAMGRSNSTPGLVESKGRIPLEEMWISPLEPLRANILGGSTGASPSTRSRDRHSQAASPFSESPCVHSSDEDRHSQVPGHVTTLPPSIRSGTSVTSNEDSVLDRRSTVTAHSQILSSLTTTTIFTTTTTTHPTLEVSPSGYETGSVSPASGGPYSLRLSPAPGISLHPTAAGSMRELSHETSHEALLAEIKRLRERLVTLETENASMSIKLSQQQWEVEHRLAEIEMQICGASSAGSSTEDNERNRESII